MVILISGLLGTLFTCSIFNTHLIECAWFLFHLTFFLLFFAFGNINCALGWTSNSAPIWQQHMKNLWIFMGTKIWRKPIKTAFLLKEMLFLAGQLKYKKKCCNAKSTSWTWKRKWKSGMMMNGKFTYNLLLWLCLKCGNGAKNVEKTLDDAQHQAKRGSAKRRSLFRLHL